VPLRWLVELGKKVAAPKSIITAQRGKGGADPRMFSGFMS
jgi:hypothetical protein